MDHECTIVVQTTCIYSWWVVIMKVNMSCEFKMDLDSSLKVCQAFLILSMFYVNKRW